MATSTWKPFLQRPRFEVIEEQQKIFEAANEHSSKPVEVNKIEDKSPLSTNVKQKQTMGDRSVECTRCGYTGHKSFDEKCLAKGKTCNKCGGKDHFSRKCRSQKSNWSTGYSKNQSESKDTTKSEPEPESKRPKPEEADESVKYVGSGEYVFCIGDHQNEIEGKIGGIGLKVVIDSGSRFNMIDQQTWEALEY